MAQKPTAEAGILYVVPTPVGNLDDMTVRAVNVLKEVDVILAEDTRTSGVLMKHFGIETRMQSHHKFNEHETAAGIAQRLKGGERIALVSDAGTPAISDPGFMLVRECRRVGVKVECLPGATAFVPALVDSGLPCDKFCFEGFLPQKKGRSTRLAELSVEPRTIVFYESPLRLVKTLTQLAEAFGQDREASVSREISKLHEETCRGTLSELCEHFSVNEPRGEIVIVVSGKKEEKSAGKRDKYAHFKTEKKTEFTMKKMMILALALTGALVACNGNKEQKDALADTTQPDISKVEGQRDSLMNLIGDISQNLLEVNRMENILVSGDFKDTPDKRQEIIANINALRQELDARKQALEELESKLKSSNGYSAKLQKTIESQKQLIDEQSQKIQQLEAALADANVKISDLNKNVEDLNTQVSTVTEERNAETQRADKVTDELNICYYVCGSNKELKEHKILEKKFLGKTKTMEGDFDRSYFTKADKRKLTEVKTYAKKAELKTSHPAGSYSMETVGGTVVIKIKDAKKFWEKSNFLVIQTK